MTLSEQLAVYRALLREAVTCLLPQGELPDNLARWWKDEEAKIQAERDAQEALKQAKRQELEHEIAALQAELAKL